MNLGGGLPLPLNGSDSATIEAVTVSIYFLDQGSDIVIFSPSQNRTSLYPRVTEIDWAQTTRTTGLCVSGCVLSAEPVRLMRIKLMVILIRDIHDGGVIQTARFVEMNILGSCMYSCLRRISS